MLREAWFYFIKNSKKTEDIYTWTVAASAANVSLEIWPVFISKYRKHHDKLQDSNII